MRQDIAISNALVGVREKGGGKLKGQYSLMEDRPVFNKVELALPSSMRTSGLYVKVHVIDPFFTVSNAELSLVSYLMN